MEVGGKRIMGKSKQEDSRKSEIKALFFSFLLSHCSGRKKEKDGYKGKKKNERYLLRVIFIFSEKK